MILVTLGLWHPPGLPASYCNPSVLQQARNVGLLKSFAGAYKVLTIVIPQRSALPSPLDTVVAGRQSHERINWSDNLLAFFHHAQSALSTSRSISLPRPDDQLWIITDGAVKTPGIGATL